MAEKTLQATTTSTSYNFNTAANYSDLAAPANSDVIFAAGAGNVDTGLARNSLTGLSLYYPMAFTGTVGVADTGSTNASVSITRSSSTATVTHTAHGYSNTTGQAVVITGATQTEYNGVFEITYVDANTYTYTVSGTPATPATGSPKSRKLDELYFSDASTTAAAVRIGDPSLSATVGSGSGRIKINCGTANVSAYVVNTAGSSTDTGKPPVQFNINNTSAKLVVAGGRVGVATNRSDWTVPNQTYASRVGEIAVVGSTAVVNVGHNVTLTTLRQTAGTATVDTTASIGTITTITQDGGTATINGTGAVTTANVAGTCFLNTTGTITTLNVRPGGHADLRNSFFARTITTVNLYEDATLSYDPEIVTITNPINLVNTDPEKVTINIPKGCTVAIVAA